MHLLIKHHWDTTHKTWSPTHFTTHVARHGRTLCRNGKPDADPRGTISSRGWRLSLRGKPQHISCKSCLQHLEKTAIETTLIEQVSEEKTHSSERHPSLLPHLLTQITHARSLHQAHLYLAWACASELEEDEIATYQEHQLFLPHQCLRLVLLLHTANESSLTATSVPPASLACSQGMTEPFRDHLQETAIRTHPHTESRSFATAPSQKGSASAQSTKKKKKKKNALDMVVE